MISMAKSKLAEIFTASAIMTILVLIAGPLLLIWILNTLFQLHLGYGIVEWFAAFLFLVIMFALIGGGTKKCR
jgi:hypothetical protein